MVFSSHVAMHRKKKEDKDKATVCHRALGWQSKSNTCTFLLTAVSYDLGTTEFLYVPREYFGQEICH